MIPLRYPLKGTKDVRFIEVQAGQRIEILVRDGINVAEDIWGPDARQFRPERWLEKDGIPETVSEIHAQGNMLSFGDGYANFHSISRNEGTEVVFLDPKSVSGDNLVRYPCYLM